MGTFPCFTDGYVKTREFGQIGFSPQKFQRQYGLYRDCRLKPGLNIVVTMAEYVCDDTSKSFYCLSLKLVKALRKGM